MDFIYLVDLNSYLSDEELKLDDFCNCCLSNKNILALSNDCFTYIVPLEKPNELIPVGVSNSACINLAWSDDANHLLCMYKNGLVNIYNIKTTLLNSIELVYTYQLNSNDILAIKSFTKTPKMCFNFEKKDSLINNEKFYYKSFNFLKNYTKFCYSGFVMLTKSGILHIFLTDYNSVKSKFEKYEFDLNLNQDQQQVEQEERQRHDLGDFSFDSDGLLNIAMSSSEPSSPVLIYKVNLSLSNDLSRVEGTCDLVYSLNIYLDNNLPSKKKSLNFCINESNQLLNVCLSFNNEPDQIQIWKQNYMSSFEMCNEGYNLLKTIQCSSSLVKLSNPKCFISFKDLSDNHCLNNESFYLIASYENGTCGFLDIQSFNQTFISMVPIRSDSYELDFNSSKKLKFNHEYIIRLDQSYSGSIGIGLTNQSRLVLFRQPYLKDSSLNHVFNLYEYLTLSGYDYWDLLVNTNPKMIDCLIEKFEDKFQNNYSQKNYFNRHYSLMFNLHKKSSSYNNSKCLDILVKLILNRLVSVVSNSVQMNLNMEHLKSLFNSNSTQTNSISLSLLSSNMDMINQSNGLLGQIQFKSNLYEYISDILKLKPNDLKQLTLNDIVQFILSKKNYQISLNQQIKHVLQFCLDIGLYLINLVPSIKQNQNQTKIQFGSILLTDLWFTNEIRKVLIIIKLLVTYNSQSLIFLNSIPVLPLRSSMQKDLLSDLFNIFSKMIYKQLETGTFLNDESILDLCLNIQAETIVKPIDELFFNLKHSWLGSMNSIWSKTVQFKVDHIFDSEKLKNIYPLFDIVRMIQFSRSQATKQCIRCGNFTESNQTKNLQFSKINCIYAQDMSGDKCICGGYWVLTNLFQ